MKSSTSNAVCRIVAAVAVMVLTAPAAFAGHLIVFGGPMGAGKSFAFERLSDGYMPELKGYNVIDSDLITKESPQYQTAVDKLKAADDLHPWAVGEMFKRLNEAIAAGEDVILFNSLTNGAGLRSRIDSFRKLQPQLKVSVINVTAPLNVALSRNEARAASGGHRVPPEKIKLAIENNAISLQAVSASVDEVIEIENIDKLEVRKASGSRFSKSLQTKFKGLSCFEAFH